MAQNEIETTTERLDIEACEENLDHYTQAGDARSCRDIGLALARELTAVREQADKLEDFAEWLADMGDPAVLDAPRAALTQIRARARKALGKED